jgi:hypothetical protein
VDGARSGLLAAKLAHSQAVATLPQVLHSRTEEEMDAIPLEVWTAFLAIAAGGFLILAGYIINKWRK